MLVYKRDLTKGQRTKIKMLRTKPCFNIFLLMTKSLTKISVIGELLIPMLLSCSVNPVVYPRVFAL